MRIVHQDTKKGVIELVPETLDDLWHLSHIIETGDLISSRTTRRIQDSTGERLRSDRGIKKTFFMGILVESINFHKYTGKLRATGIIEHGPEDLVPLGSHHTLDLKLNYSIKITKEKWSRWAIKRVKNAVDSSKKPSAIIVAIEDDVADLGIIKQYGIDYYGPIIGGISGKRIIQKDRGKNIANFFDEVAKALSGFKDIQGIVIAGPGFTKGEFYNFLGGKYPELAKISGVESTGTGGRVGIQEVLRKGTIEEMAAENRIAQEMRFINKVLEEIGKSSNLVTYGKKEVMDASNAGAAEMLLVLDEMVREDDVEGIMNLVENTGGKVMVISSEHEGGKQLKSLGGIAALLRYGLK
ncbi:MAG: mRNA surveillance protein pelota [Methanobacterium sp.]|uniref:mRNA surveillance protein pelota n=1 Tax=Methanobacterium sp. TaxID=2164 RepID=UPI003D64752F|nr:mRNA surveillance protein pelota [Methanobacterium sp.]